MKSLHVVPILVLATLFGCTANPPADVPLVFEPMAGPAGPMSGRAHLSAVPGGGLYLSWTAPVADTLHGMYAAPYVDGGWGTPDTIATGANWFVNWADFPMVMMRADGPWVAHFLEKRAAATYAYDVRVTQSTDQGRTWTPALTPHRDATETEHGFVSLLPWQANQTGLIWLDGRNYATAEEMTLRFATLDATGTLAAETELDARVCDCCQTAAVRTPNGALAFYRDRSATDPEVRDLAYVRYANGAWSAPKPLHADGWQINGCPVNGPAAAARGGEVAVAWYTAAEDQPKVLLKRSSDEGASFGAPVVLSDTAPLGRVDVALDGQGRAWVSWLEREGAGEGAEIRLTSVGADGHMGLVQTVAQNSVQRKAGLPRLAVYGDTLLVMAWTHIEGDETTVRTARAALPNR